MYIKKKLPGYNRVGVRMKVSFLGYDNEAKLAAEKEEISEKISKEIRDLPGSDRFFIVEFSISGDSLDAASELSGIRGNKLFSDFRLLDDDPSERFERDLFKQIALFERQLRKLITISLCPQRGCLDVDLVARLESLSFGDLFDALFIDDQFNTNAKKMINNKSCRFEKLDLIQTLSGVEETSLWSKTFSDDEMPTVRKKHRLIQCYRNDVMHAHRMSSEVYRDARSLLRKVNEELDMEIARRLNSDIDIDIDYLQLAKNLSEAIELFNNHLLQSVDLEALRKVFQILTTDLIAAGKPFNCDENPEDVG